MREVALSADSLNNSDVFILDTGMVLYQMNGSLSTGLERVKGLWTTRQTVSEGRPLSRTRSSGLAPLFTPDAGAELSHSLHDDRGGKPEIVVFTETDRERALDVRA